MMGTVLLLGMLAFLLSLGSLCGLLHGESGEPYFFVSLLAISMVVIVASVVLSEVFGGVWASCTGGACGASWASIILVTVMGIIVLVESTLAGISMSNAVRYEEK